MPRAARGAGAPLRPLGLGESTPGPTVPQLRVWTKVDRGAWAEGSSGQSGAPALREAEGTGEGGADEPEEGIATSVVTGEGLDELLAAIDERLGKADEIVTVVLPASEGRLLGWLYDNAEVVDRKADDETGNVTCRVRIASEKRGRLLARLGTQGVVVR